MASQILLIPALLVLAAASGLIGAFALMRRMSLAADAMSHIALPGIGIALLFSINPFVGGLAALLIGALLIWGIEAKTGIATETIIGVIFSASLAIGSLIIPDHELLEALFGNLLSITNLELSIGIVAGLAVIALVLWSKERLTLSILVPDIAKTVNINNRRLNLFFLIIFSTTIILGLKFLGALLMGSLIIIPAATAKNLATNLKSDLLIASLSAMLIAGLGFFIAMQQGWNLGPTIIATAAIFFLFSFLVPKGK